MANDTLLLKMPFYITSTDTAQVLSEKIQFQAYERESKFHTTWAFSSGDFWWFCASLFFCEMFF